MITIEHLSCPQTEDVVQIARAYRQIFGDEPWDEGYRCLTCEAIFPLRGTFVLCPQCEERGETAELVDYWPEEKVASDFCLEMSKPGSRCLVARDGDDLVGFAWGYQLAVNDELDGKLEAPGLASLLPSGTFFYCDETGVIKSYRNQGVGTKLARSLFSGQERVLLRTLADSTMFRIVKRLGGGVVSRITRNRVIMRLG